MYIQEVISYKGSWNTCNNNYKNELIEIMDALSDFINGHVKIENEENNFPRRVWDKALYDKGWRQPLETTSGVRLDFQTFGWGSLGSWWLGS